MKICGLNLPGRGDRKFIPCRRGTSTSVVYGISKVFLKRELEKTVYNQEEIRQLVF